MSVLWDIVHVKHTAATSVAIHEWQVKSGNEAVRGQLNDFVRSRADHSHYKLTTDCKYCR